MKLLAALVLFAALSAPAPAAAGTEGGYLADVNAMRADAGLPALTVDADAEAYARWWSDRLAEAGVLSHSSSADRAGIPGAWVVVGENVGAGVERAAIMAMFAASSTHYANIVDPRFDTIGIGVTWGADRMYVTHIFLDEDQPAPAATVVAEPEHPPSPVEPEHEPPAACLLAWFDRLLVLDQGVR